MLNCIRAIDNQPTQSSKKETNTIGVIVWGASSKRDQPNSASKGSTRVLFPVFVGPTRKGTRLVLDGPATMTFRSASASAVLSKFPVFCAKNFSAASARDTCKSYAIELCMGRKKSLLNTPAHGVVCPRPRNSRTDRRGGTVSPQRGIGAPSPSVPPPPRLWGPAPKCGRRPGTPATGASAWQRRPAWLQCRCPWAV